MVSLHEDFSQLDPEVWGAWGEPGPYLAKGRVHIPFDPVLTTRTSGIAMRQAFLYRSVNAKLRATVGNFRVCALLWPEEGGSPPEIDFCEMGADQRHRTDPTQTVWHDDRTADHSAYGAPMTDFQWVGVIWSRAGVVFTLNGTPILTRTWSPSVPMKLAFQVGIPFDPRVRRQPGELIVAEVTVA